LKLKDYYGDNNIGHLKPIKLYHKGKKDYIMTRFREVRKVYINKINELIIKGIFEISKQSSLNMANCI
jgi:hypothetical protein